MTTAADRPADPAARPERGSATPPAPLPRRRLRRAVRAAVVVVVLAHGALHLLGSAAGLGAEVDGLTVPVSPAAGVGWALAAVAVVAAAILLARRAVGWWWVGAAAAALSQAMLATAWHDARAGTAANVVLLVAAAHGWAADGPRGLRAEYRRRSGAALAAAALADDGDVVTEADLAGLPPVVATYLRRSGVLGRPRVGAFRATFHGRIRGDAGGPWMPFTGEQVSTYGPDPGRWFLLDATMAGLPVDVLHVYEHGHATMRARACSLVTVLDGSGPDMDQGETVTLLNDACLMAPGALVDLPLEWTELDRRHVRVTWTVGASRVAAVLAFDDDGDLRDFVSDDRLQASRDGSTFTPRRWATPVAAYRWLAGGRVVGEGGARWLGPADGEELVYAELSIDDVVHLPRG